MKGKETGSLNDRLSEQAKAKQALLERVEAYETKLMQQSQLLAGVHAMEEELMSLKDCQKEFRQSTEMILVLLSFMIYQGANFLMRTC